MYLLAKLHIHYHNILSMYKILFVLLFSFLSGICCFSQVIVSGELKQMFVILPKYQSASFCSEGMLSVSKDDIWGIIDYQDRKVIDFKYHSASKFSYNLFLVSNDSGFFYIKKTGIMLTNNYYKDAGDFSDSLAYVQDKIANKYGFIGLNGNIVIPCKYDGAMDYKSGLFPVKKGNKWGFIDKSTNVVLPFKYDNVGVFGEGLAAVKIANKWGFINKSGTLVVPANYDMVGIFSNGLAFFKKDGKYGYINKNNQIIIQPTYKRANDFSNGLAAVLLDKKYGYIDTTGALIIPASFDIATKFSQGYATVALKDTSSNFFYGLLKSPFLHSSNEDTQPTVDDNNNISENLIDSTIYKICGEKIIGLQGDILHIHQIKSLKQKFSIMWEVINVPFGVEIYKGRGIEGEVIFKEKQLKYTGQKQLSCDSEYITVRILAKKSGTEWRYKIICD